MNKFTLCSVLLLLITLAMTPLNAQTSTKLDSLVQANAQYNREDTVKVRMLINLALGYRKNNPGLAIGFSEQALALVKKMDKTELTGEALYASAKVNYNLNNYAKAVELAEESMPYFERANNKTVMGNILLSLGSYHFNSGNYTESIATYEKGANLFSGLKDKAKTAMCFNGMALSYTYIPQPDKAIDLYKQSLAISQSLGDQLSVLSTYNNLGIYYYGQSDFINALEYFNKALKTNETLGNFEQQIQLLNNLGGLYFRLGDYPKAIEYDQLVLVELNKKPNYNPLQRIRTYVNLGAKYKSMNDFQKSLEYSQLALPLCDKPDLKAQRAVCLSNMGVAYESLHDLEKSLDYHNEALSIFEEVKSAPEIARTLINLGTLYSAAPDSVLQKKGIHTQDKQALSEEKLLAGLKIAESIGAQELIAAALGRLSTTYQQKGDYIKAYQAFKRYLVVKDSISSDEVKKQITRKEIQFEFDKKEAELKFENQHTFDLLEQQKLTALQQDQNLRIKDQALTIANKEKDLQRLAYLKEKAEKQEREQQLALAEKDKQLQAADLATLAGEKALQLKSLAEKNALIGFLIASLIALMLGVFAFYAWQRQKRARLETAVQQQFTRQLFQNTEEERGRIARDLHDGVSHELLALRRELQNANSTKRIDHIINGVRQISRNLHPVMLESIGLKLSLETLCEQYMEQHELFISHDVQYTGRVAGNTELQLFRIVQEALSNTIKYASANAGKVTLNQQNGALHLSIQDNGRGFNVQNALNSGKAFGLHSIVQRSKAVGGEARIQSTAQGTMIDVTIPAG